MSRKSLHFVLKISKYCNLRCSYCYEFNELANKSRMSIELLDNIFRQSRNFAIENGIEHIRFTWHGGEPFMVPVEQYREIAALQADIFGDDVKIRNSVQTNLTFLPDKLLSYLEERTFFQGIGVSFDVHGDQRVDTRGRSSTRKVLENLEIARRSGVVYGAITVLARNTLPHLAAIVDFYQRIEMPFRILPFYMSAFAEQVDRHAITQGELIEAMRTTFDLWLQLDRPISIDPLDEYITHAMDFLLGYREETYDKNSDEIVFVVDVDGSVSGMSDTYDPQRTYGNLTRMGMDAVLGSAPRRRVVAETHQRMERHCVPCRYFGACPGYFVAEASPAQREAMDRDGCPTRAIIDHIVERLERLDDLPQIMSRVRRDRATTGATLMAAI